MNKKEIAEIKKQLTPDRCAITRICGCYVDAEKEKKAELKEAFLSLPEEEMYKYFDIFRKSLSGTLGKNLLNMEFPLETEAEGGSQEFLRRLLDSRLTDDGLLTQFYDKVIETYEYGEHYLILLIHTAYEVYSYIQCCICPVNLSKPGLSYNSETNTFQNRIRDWIVELPDLGFLFPAFNDRSTDLHSTLYYSKNPELLHWDIAGDLLGCTLPMTASDQKESFNALIAETLGDGCDYDTVKAIHENLNELLEAQKDSPDPVTLDKADVKYLLAKSGVEEEKLETLDTVYESAAPSAPPFLASNVASTRKFEIKTPDIVIQVSPERADLVETRTIDGRDYLVIPVDDSVQINGIPVRCRVQEEE